MLLMVPILVSMYLRIYRVKRVFELYEKYLDREQKRAGSCFSYNRTFQSQVKPNLGLDTTDTMKVNAAENEIWRQTLPKIRGNTSNQRVKSQYQHPTSKVDQSEMSEQSAYCRHASENYDEKKSLLKSQSQLGDSNRSMANGVRVPNYNNSNNCGNEREGGNGNH